MKPPLGRLLEAGQGHNAKNGISSYEIGRAIGVSQPCAWFMAHRIRLVLQGDPTLLGGKSKSTRPYIGGSARFIHKGKRAAKIKGGTGVVGKVAVMGLLERHGPDGHSRVTTKVIPNIKRRTLAPEGASGSSPVPTCSRMRSRPTTI